MPVARARKQSEAPKHEYAADHKLLEAQRQYGTRRRLRDAAELRSSAEVACERIREFCWDLGAELEWNRWMAEIARRLGVPYSTAWQIMSGRLTAVSPKTVDRIARATGIPVGVIYDPEA